MLSRRRHPKNTLFSTSVLQTSKAGLLWRLNLIINLITEGPQQTQITAMCPVLKLECFILSIFDGQFLHVADVCHLIGGQKLLESVIYELCVLVPNSSCRHSTTSPFMNSFPKHRPHRFSVESSSNGPEASSLFNLTQQEEASKQKQSMHSTLFMNDSSIGWSYNPDDIERQGSPPAKWPQTPGMTRSSAFFIWLTSYSSSATGKYRSTSAGITIALACTSE